MISNERICMCHSEDITLANTTRTQINVDGDSLTTSRLHLSNYM